MNPVLSIAWLGILTLAPLSHAETIPGSGKAEEITSLQGIAMLFDGGSIRFRFMLSSGSILELILNDQEQMGGLLPGVPEHSAGDWWLWLVKNRATSLLVPDKAENQEIRDMLINYLKRHSDIDSHARQQIHELVAILKDRGRKKVSYDFWTGYKRDTTKKFIAPTTG